MMIAVLDNNILIDALEIREPFAEAAQQILRESAQGKYICCFTSNSATDIYYVLNKRKGKEYAKAAITKLLNLLPVVSVTGQDCQQALDLPIDDFEDALLVVCAAKAQADCIITGDKDFLKAGSPVKVILPVDFLSEQSE